MKSSPLEVFCRTLVEQRSVRQCIIVSDNFSIIQKSKGTRFSDNSNSSFSRWDSHPTPQQHHEKVAIIGLLKEEDTNAYHFLDCCSSSGSTLGSPQHASREQVNTSPPRLPARRNSFGSLSTPSLDVTEDFDLSDNDDKDDDDDGGETKYVSYHLCTPRVPGTIAFARPQGNSDSKRVATALSNKLQAS